MRWYPRLCKFCGRRITMRETRDGWLPYNGWLPFGDDRHRCRGGGRLSLNSILGFVAIVLVLLFFYTLNNR
jgi:hypothetical protein